MSVTSWGNYPYHAQTTHPVYWREELADVFKRVAAQEGMTLAYGQGRSYGDACLASSDHVITLSGLDRLISADWERGVVRAEAGVTLGALLHVSIPRGWFLPVTPGTQYVTLGGAVANDVHGKNHHVRGTFGQQVTAFKLIRSESDPVVCSSTDNAALFSATIGGLGLTGLIEWVEIQLMPITSSQLQMKTVRFDRLSEFFALSETLDTAYEYTVAWIDCLSKGDQLGRGVFMAANHAPSGELVASHRRNIALPITPPVSLINGLTLRTLNTLYYQRHPTCESVVDYAPFFYPLDSVLHWNRMYGKKGFQQYQCVIPKAHGEQATRALLTEIASSGQGSCLAVLKQCGPMVSPGLLSFPMEGVSLALDFPQHNALEPLFNRLDVIVREAGGRLYPAKDAHMSGEDFRRGYPQWEKLSALRDPALCSRFWKRVTAS